MGPVEELDLLFSLQTSEGVQKVYELHPPPVSGNEEAYRFLVAVSPYNQSVIIAAHYRAIDATGQRPRDVLFFNAEHPPHRTAVQRERKRA